MFGIMATGVADILMDMYGGQDIEILMVAGLEEVGSDQVAIGMTATEGGRMTIESKASPLHSNFSN